MASDIHSQDTKFIVLKKFINILINQRKRITFLLTDVQKNSDKIQYTSMIKYLRT